MSESNCCGAPIVENTDLCSKCLEHCDEIEVFCTSCDWEGKNDDLEMDGENDSLSSWINFYCPKCHSQEIEDV